MVNVVNVVNVGALCLAGRYGPFRRLENGVPVAENAKRKVPRAKGEPVLEPRTAEGVSASRRVMEAWAIFCGDASIAKAGTGTSNREKTSPGCHVDQIVP